MVPEMGGPTSAPIAVILINMPIRLPTSPLTPIDIIGNVSKELYVPIQNLRILVRKSSGRDVCKCLRAPIQNGDGGE
jgi:hypothetical protein